MAVFNGLPEDATSPARQWFVITPDDTTPLARSCRALWVNGEGNVAVVAEDGSEVIFTVGAGTMLPVQPVRVKATGTTATGIIGLY